jgi:hypothetical protein
MAPQFGPANPMQMYGPPETSFERVRRHILGIAYDLSNWDALEPEERSLAFIIGRDDRAGTCCICFMCVLVALAVVWAMCGGTRKWYS